MSEIIQDGAGTGNRVRVSTSNRLWVDGIEEPLAAERSRAGLLYGCGTGSVTLAGSESLAPMLWLQNNDSNYNFAIVKLIFGWNGGSTNHNRTVLSFIRYQMSVPSAARSAATPAIENISMSGATAAVTDSGAVAWKWDGTGSSGMTGGSGGYLQIPNRIAQGNTVANIDGQIILGQGDTMQMEVTPEETGLYNVAIVYYKDPVAGRI